MVHLLVLLSFLLSSPRSAEVSSPGWAASRAGGQLLSALVGCICRLVFKDVIWLSAAVGMSLALLCMIITKTTHPPGKRIPV